MTKNFPYCKNCRDWKPTKHIMNDPQCKFHDDLLDSLRYAAAVDFAKEPPKRPSVLRAMLEAIGAAILAALFIILLFALMVIQPL